MGFANFTHERMTALLQKFGQGKGKFIEEKQTKVGREPVLLEIGKVNDLTLVKGAADSLLCWRDEEGNFCKLPLNKKDNIGVERLNSGREAMVILGEVERDKGDRQIIRKFYREE